MDQNLCKWIILVLALCSVLAFRRFTSNGLILANGKLNNDNSVNSIVDDDGYGHQKFVIENGDNQIITKRIIKN